MITITCLILPIPAAPALADGPGGSVPADGGLGAVVVVVVVGLLEWWDDPQDVNSDDTMATPAPAITTRLRGPRMSLSTHAV
jgi:hypothetical protein